MTDRVEGSGAVAPAQKAEGSLVTPSLGHILVVALVVGIFAVLWLVTYSQLNDLIWQNSFVASNRWVIPVGVVFFSLLVGLTEKYLHAPNVIEGGVDVALKSEDVATYRSFWGTLLSSLFSLWSGASVGPEGPLGFLAVEISQWIAAKLRFTKQGALVTSLAGMSAAYNGIVGNPVFATLLAVEATGAKGGLALVGSSLVAGTVGFLLFALLGVKAFAGFLDVGTVSGITLQSVGGAIVLGFIGALVALYIGIAFRGFGKAMGVFKDRVIVRALVAGVIIGVVCYFVPNLMFSGESEIHTIMANPAQYGLGMLLLMALLKPLLLALSLKGGFLGGPIFPALFTSTMVGLAISLLVPGAPLAVLIMCPAVGVITLLLRAPLTAILLVSVLVGAGASADMLGLIAVSAATALCVSMFVQGRMAARGPQGPPAAAPSPAR